MDTKESIHVKLLAVHEEMHAIDYQPFSLRRFLLKRGYRKEYNTKLAKLKALHVEARDLHNLYSQILLKR